MFVDGYFTTDNNLRGKTPKEIEHILGLLPGMLAEGARVLQLIRAPNLAEFEVRGSTRRADGRGLDLDQAERTKSIPGAWHGRRLVKVVPLVAGPREGDWPDVRGVAAEQWRLRVKIPARELCQLRPGQVYPN